MLGQGNADLLFDRNMASVKYGGWGCLYLHWKNGNR
nr:MAG TPA: hypothetical protein [Bacteriophage sp.]